MTQLVQGSSIRSGYMVSFSTKSNVLLKSKRGHNQIGNAYAMGFKAAAKLMRGEKAELRKFH
jgi:hypothetical protein